MARKTLIVAFDVTDLSDEEIAGLELEAVVQGESSEHHPDVHVESIVVDRDYADLYGEWSAEESVTPAPDKSATDRLRGMVLAVDLARCEDEVQQGIGRGPTGRLRNFGQMGDDKLKATYRALLDEGRDKDAIEAVQSVMEQRDIESF